MSNYNRIKNKNNRIENERILYSDLFNKITRLEAENSNLKFQLNKINQEAVYLSKLGQQNAQLKKENVDLKAKLKELKENLKILEEGSKKIKNLLSYTEELEKRISDFEKLEKRISDFESNPPVCVSGNFRRHIGEDSLYHDISHVQYCIHKLDGNESQVSICKDSPLSLISDSQMRPASCLTICKDSPLSLISDSKILLPASYLTNWNCGDCGELFYDDELSGKLMNDLNSGSQNDIKSLNGSSESKQNDNSSQNGNFEQNFKNVKKVNFQCYKPIFEHKKMVNRNSKVDTLQFKNHIPQESGKSCS